MASNVGNGPSKITGYGGGTLNSIAEGKGRQVYMQVERTSKGDERWIFTPNNETYSKKVDEQSAKFLKEFASSVRVPSSALFIKKPSSVEPEWKTVDFQKFDAIDPDTKERILAVVRRALTTSGSMDYVVEELNFDGFLIDSADESMIVPTPEEEEGIDESMMVSKCGDDESVDESLDGFHLPLSAKPLVVNGVDAQNLRGWTVSFLRDEVTPIFFPKK